MLPGRCRVAACGSGYDRAVPSKLKTTISPFRIHSVEPFSMTTPEEASEAIRHAGYNLHATDFLTDLLTDPGTGAMSLPTAVLNHTGKLETPFVDLRGDDDRGDRPSSS